MKRSIFALAVVLFVIVALLPFLYMLVSSWIGEGRLSGEHYARILTGTRQLFLLRNSLLVAGLSALLAVLIGVPLALFISRTDMPGRGVLTLLCFIPLVVPPYINAISWIYLLGEKGILNLLLNKILPLNNSLLTIYGMAGTVFILTLAYFPFVTLLTAAALKSLDPALEEAGRMFTSQFSVLRKISLPLVMPAILTGGLFVFILAISNFGVPALLRVNTYPVEVFIKFGAFFNYQAATAVALPLVVIILIVILALGLYLRRKSYATVATGWHHPKMVNLERGRWPAFLFCLLIVTLAVLLPVGVLLYKAGSLTAYRTVLVSAQGQILNSLRFSALGATGLVSLGVIIAYMVERLRSFGQRTLSFCSVLPFSFPATVLGVGLIKLWNHPGVFNRIYATSAIIILAYGARFIPFAVKMLSSSLKQINPALEEAALIGGASWGRTVFKIIIPLMKRGLLAAWIFSFILCMGELGTSILVCPAGQITLPVRLFSLMHFAPEELIAALCIILIGIVLIPLFLLWAMLPKRIHEGIIS